MTENTTNSAELRQFATDNAGRRKIDVSASLELHRRAANQIDSLSAHVHELRQRVARAGAAEPAPAAIPTPGEEPSQSALMVLQKAQQTADETIAEADRIRADADRTRREADAIAQAKADSAVAQARVEAAAIIEAAEARAGEIAAASAVAAEQAVKAQRAYHAKASSLRADAESVVNLARNMETVAGEDLPPALTQEPFTQPVHEPVVAATPIPAPEPAETVPEAAADEVEAPAPVAEEPNLPPPPPADEAELPPPPAPVAPDLLPPPPPAAETEAPAAQLPPPPPAAAVNDDAELIDLTEADLENALGGKSIDDELFGDDVVIDLTDDEDSETKNFEFFTRD